MSTSAIVTQLSSSGRKSSLHSTNTPSYLATLRETVYADLAATVSEDELIDQIEKHIAVRASTELKEAVESFGHKVLYRYQQEDLPVAEATLRRLCCAMIELIDARKDRRVQLEAATKVESAADDDEVI